VDEEGKEEENEPVPALHHAAEAVVKAIRIKSKMT